MIVSLKNVFCDIAKYNISVNLTDSYCNSSIIDENPFKNKNKNKKYIGYIYSPCNIYNIMESLNEEGSCLIVYICQIRSIEDIEDITNIINSSFKNYGYEIKIKYPTISEMRISVVIMKHDLTDEFIDGWSGCDSECDNLDEDYIESDGGIENDKDVESEDKDVESKVSDDESEVSKEDDDDDDESDKDDVESDDVESDDEVTHGEGGEESVYEKIEEVDEIDSDEE